MHLEVDATQDVVSMAEQEKPPTIKKEHYLQLLSQSQLGFLGALAGGITCFFDQPTLYCKAMTQQKRPLSFNLRVLYRGLPANILNTGVLTAIQFWGSGAIMKCITGGKVRDLTLGEELASGFVGGAISGPACCWFELCVIQQQNNGGNILNTLSRLKNLGWKAMNRGMVTSTLRESFFTMSYIAVAPIFQRKCEEMQIPFVNPVLTGAVGAGILSGVLTQPVDTVKTCMQADVNQTKYGNIRQTAAAIMERGGYQSLFSGLLWRTGGMTIIVFVFNNARLLLAPPIHQQNLFDF